MVVFRSACAANRWIGRAADKEAGVAHRTWGGELLCATAAQPAMSFP